MKKRLIVATLTVYLFIVAALTIVPTQISSTNGPHAEHVNLVPFTYTINCILMAHRRHPDLMSFCLRNTFGNLVLFLPLGILLPLTSERFRSWKKIITTALLLSLSIETIQFFSRFVGSLRAFDIDDVLLNTFGACIGFALYSLVSQTRKKRRGLH